MYTVRFVHSGMAREELSPIWIEGADLHESVREPRSWRNRSSRGQDLVTIGVRVTVPCWEWQEPAGLAEKCKNVQETKGN